MSLSSPSLSQAFVLGAGLGTRLKPLTEKLPKPLVPVVGQPLISHAFDHLIGSGIERFIVNTHHRAEAYADAFPDQHHRGHPITFRHEPELLETGGGLQNISDLARDQPLLVYNGDIFSTLPLSPAISHHLASGHEVTLILREKGSGARNVGFRATGSTPCSGAYATGLITDLRHRLGHDPGSTLFSGIYLVSPAFFHRLKPGKISVVEPWLEMIAEGIPVGGIVINEGEWWDLGTREQLLGLHAHLRPTDPASWVAEDAFIGENVSLSGASFIGSGATIGRGAALTDTVVWPGAEVAPGARLCRCIVTGSRPAAGEATDADF